MGPPLHHELWMVRHFVFAGVTEGEGDEDDFLDSTTYVVVEVKESYMVERGSLAGDGVLTSSSARVIT